MADLVREVFQVVVFLEHDDELLVAGSEDLCGLQVDRFDEVLDVLAENRGGAACEEVVGGVVGEDELGFCWLFSCELEEDVPGDEPALLLRRRLSCPLVQQLDGQVSV